MKTHLLDSSVPLTEGQDQIAICGENVKDAAFVSEFIADPIDLSTLRSALRLMVGLCSKCKKERISEMYLYAITDGQNVRVGEEA